MPRFDVNESRLNRTIDRGRGRDIDSLFTPFKSRRIPTQSPNDSLPKREYPLGSGYVKGLPKECKHCGYAQVHCKCGAFVWDTPQTHAGRVVPKREIVTDSLLLAKFMCIHAVPYVFNGTKYGCKRCNPR